MLSNGTRSEEQVMRKILILTNHSFMLYRFRRELIAELLKENEVVLSMPCDEYVGDFKAMGCKIIDTYVNRRGINPITDIRLLRTYFKIIRGENPDLVITYSIKPNVYGGYICSKLGISYCVNVQGLGTAFQKKGLEKVVTIMYKIALEKAKIVFFENDRNAELFRQRNITTVKHQMVLHGAGINLDYYPYQPYAEDGCVRFLFVGRIMREKGINELFYAAKKIKAEYGDKVVFDLVGFFEDEYKETVEQLEREGIIIFHGFQQEVRTFYAKANCVVLPSYHEGMSNVLLEAASTGRVLITSDISGCREAVEPDVSGYLCPVANSESIYCSMRRILTLTAEERKIMGIAGRKRMESLFDKRKVVMATLAGILED